MVQAVHSPAKDDSTRRANSILVLDGNEDHQALSVTALGRRGFRVSIADDAREGVRLARSQPFDVIVLAHKLRGASGLDALRVFAQQFPKVPKIFVVAEGSEDLALRALDAGASGYLFKTANYHELLPAAVEEQIAKVRDRTRLQRQHEALEETQARYRQLVETTASPGFAVDAEGRFVEVNEVFGSLLGFTPEELLEMRFTDLLPPGLRGDGRVPLPELSRRPPSQRVEVPLRRKDGTEVALEILPGPRRAATDGARFEFVAQDVTERRRAERELRDLYGWLQAVYEATNDAVLLADRDLHPVRWNAQALELLQVDAETTSRGMADALLERLAARLEDPGAILGAAARYGEDPLAVEEGTVVVKVPEPRVYRMLTVPVRNPEGALIGRLWTFRDITDQTRTDEALRKVREQLSVVVSGAPVVLFAVDRELVITFSEGRGLEALGVKAGEHVGRSILELYGPRVPGLADLFARVFRGEAVSQIIEIAGHWFDTRFAPIVDTKGEVSGVIAVALDISDRVRAERSLREAMKTLRALVDSSPAAITGIDTQGNVTIWNRAAERIFGWTAEEVLGKPLPTLPPDRVEEHLRFRKRALAGESTSGVDTRRLRKDGRLLDVQVSVAPIFDAAGKVTGTMGVLMDVSEKKRHERLRSAIYRISEAASSVAGLDELYRSIHLIVAELMAATNFYITLYDPGAGTLAFPYFVDEQESPPPPQKVGKGLTEYVLRTGKSLLADPERFEALVRSGEVELVGPPSIDWLGVPLVANGRAIGAIVVQSYAEGVRYTEQDKELLEFVSDQIAMAIERKRAEAEVRQKASELQTIFQAVPDLYFRLGEDGTILSYMAGRTSDLYAPLTAFLGKRFWDVLPQEVGGQLQDAFDRVLRTRALESIDYSLEVPSGPKVFEARLMPLLENQVVVIVRDITDRRRAEQDVRESEERYRLLFENSPQPMLVLDEQTLGILAVNEAAVSHYGYTRDEFLRMTIKDIWPPDDVPALLRELARDRGPLHDSGPGRHRKKDGTVFDVDIMSHVIRFGDRTARLVLATDITERERAEADLYHSRQMLQLVLDNIPQGVFWKDRESRYMGANRAFAQDAGLKDPTEVLGKDDFGFAWKGMAESYRADDRQVMEGDAPKLHFEESLVRPDESRRWVRTSKVPLHDKDGKVLGVLGAYEDITDRKLAEEELRRSESKFRALFEAAAEAVLLIDHDANLLDVNPAGVAVLGVSRDRLVGRNMQEFVVPEELERTRGYLRDVLRGAKVPDPFELRILTADGRGRSVEVRLRSVRDVEGAPFVEMLVRDVTDEKAIQRRLMESERLASIGVMAGYVAHEINNPLANISLLVASAERKTKDAELLEKLSKIKAQRRQAASILSDILSFSKQQEIQAVESDLRAIVEAAIDQVAPYRKKSVAVHRSLGDRPVLAEVDPLQMQEVFVNLLKNALEATASRSVTVELEERGDSLAVRVADTGAGISPDVIDRLFEPFFTTKKKVGGTGLGLALCKNVVAAHGGQIQVSSELGKGAVFTVLIPRRQSRKERSP